MDYLIEPKENPLMDVKERYKRVPSYVNTNYSKDKKNNIPKNKIDKDYYIEDYFIQRNKMIEEHIKKKEKEKNK